MSGFVDGLKTVKAIDAKVREERDRERRVVGRLAADEAEYRAELEAWRKRADESLESAQVFNESEPEPPPSREPGRVFLQRIRGEIERLQRERHKAIVASADEIDAKATKAVAAEVEKATPLLDELEQIVTRVKAAQRDLRQVFDSTNLLDANTTRPSQSPSPLDIEGLRLAIRHKVDLLTEARNPAERRLGLKWESRLEPTSASEPPIPPAPPEPSVDLVGAPQGGLEPARKTATGRDHL